MRVVVKLLATYRKNLPPQVEGNFYEMEVATGTKATDLLVMFGVPVDSSSVILVNGHSYNLNKPLEEGDVVSAFPAMAGGSLHVFNPILGRRI